MKKKYKVITLFNAIGMSCTDTNQYKTAREWYEQLKKDNYVMLSIMVNEKGKVLHIFDHTKKFSYNRNYDYFTRNDLFYEI
ncbi:unknown [Lactococcus phage Q54]|uniref:Uncharacterized protein n=1 Tax=Lactococcus phage Q54 TaxID=382685 RepID=Q0GXS8_9CAUD|nr:hypothetical protein Q54_gp44 [Lactococcus phage Q54]ABF22598.1 unknown [Lactococcus phage Q54]